MKKLLIILCAAIMGMGCASAQANKGDLAVGVNVVYGSQVDNAGFGLRLQYTPLDNIRAELGFNAFLNNDHYKNWWDINFNAEYLIGLFSQRLYLYPIVGVSFARTGFKPEGDDKAFGLNLGAGAEYKLTEHVGLSLEYRHSIMKDIDQGVFGIGANYKF